MNTQTHYSVPLVYNPRHESIIPHAWIRDDRHNTANPNVFAVCDALNIRAEAAKEEMLTIYDKLCVAPDRFEHG